jgi:hypothetical protein
MKMQHQVRRLRRDLGCYEGAKLVGFRRMLQKDALSLVDSLRSSAKKLIIINSLLGYVD